MRGLPSAAFLLAPALVAGLAASDSSVSAVVQLGGPATEGQLGSIRLDVLESSEPCGYGNVTLDGQTLAQDDDGRGFGSFTTDQDNVVAASWRFVCAERPDNMVFQLLHVNVESVNGVATEDLSFSIQFRQSGHRWIDHVAGAAILLESSQINTPSESFYEDNERSLEDEVAELDDMKLQLIELERAIYLKEVYLAQAFGHRRQSVSVGNCDNLKCVLSSVFHNVKGMAKKVYQGVMGHHRHHNPHHPKHGHLPHGNHTHGNHTGPPHRFPTHPRPPPFCHCPPPPPHHGEPGGRRPHHRPPPGGAGLEQPLETSAQGHNSSGVAISQASSPRNGHHGARLLHHIAFGFILLGLVLFCLSHTGCLAHIKTKLRERRERRRGGCVTRRRHCCERRAARREQAAARREAFRAHIQEKVHGFMQHFKDAIKTHRQRIEEEKEAIMRRIHSNITNYNSDSNDNGSDSDTMSTTMEQFRAVAGAVSDIVAAEEGRGHDQARHEASSRELLRHTLPDRPRSPTSAFPDDASVTDSLPAYEEAVDESTRIADGLRYTPGSSTYTPSTSSSSGSLDDILGRKD